MKNYSEQLQEQTKELEMLIKEAERRVNKCRLAKDTKVYVSHHKHGFQYYMLDDTGKRVYIRKEQADLVQTTFQRDYDKEVMKTLRHQYNKMVRFLKNYDIDAAARVYDNLCDARKALVNPVIPTDEEFIKKWKESHPGGQNDYPAPAVYLTQQGETVRSKSEKMLADLFLKHGIPYSYEPGLRLNSGKILYPDFVLLNVRTRKTIYWEHFGMASDEVYASKALHKLNAYEESGLEVGTDILYSLESENFPLDFRKVGEKIRKHLL